MRSSKEVVWHDARKLAIHESGQLCFTPNKRMLMINLLKRKLIYSALISRIVRRSALNVFSLSTAKLFFLPAGIGYHRSSLVPIAAPRHGVRHIGTFCGRLCCRDNDAFACPSSFTFPKLDWCSQDVASLCTHWNGRGSSSTPPHDRSCP